MKILINRLILLTGFWAFALSSNAQAPALGIKPARYRPLAQGEPAPFAGILTDIPTYRAEGEKMELQARAIAGYKEQLAGTQAQLAESMNEAAKQAEKAQKTQLQLQSCIEKGTVFDEALKTTQQAYQEVKPRFYEKPLFWGVIGFVGGIFTGVKISK